MQTIRIAGRFGRNGLATTLFRTFATSPTLKTSKVYELRLYRMKPERYRESLELLQQYWSVRAAHSQDVGSWMTELGSICETVHLWEYDSLNDRIQKRQNVADDPVWREEFLPKFFAASLKLSTVLLTPRPGTQVNTSFEPSESAVYELLNNKPGLRLSSQSGETVVGQFEPVYGRVDGEFTLLRYTDPDLAFERAYQRRKDQKGECSSRLLVPSEWSRIQ